MKTLNKLACMTTILASLYNPVSASGQVTSIPQQLIASKAQTNVQTKVAPQETASDSDGEASSLELSILNHMSRNEVSNGAIVADLKNYDLVIIASYGHKAAKPILDSIKCGLDNIGYRQVFATEPQILADRISDAYIENKDNGSRSIIVASPEPKELDKVIGYINKNIGKTAKIAVITEQFGYALDQFGDLHTQLGSKQRIYDEFKQWDLVGQIKDLKAKLTKEVPSEVKYAIANGKIYSIKR